MFFGERVVSSLYRRTDVSRLPRRASDRAHPIAGATRRIRSCCDSIRLRPDRQRRAVVLLNRQLLATLILTWNPDRVGSYPLLLPADKVRVGTNELTIVPDTLVAAGSAGHDASPRDPDDLLGVRLWYVRVLGSPPVPATDRRNRRHYDAVFRSSRRKLNFIRRTSFSLHARSSRSRRSRSTVKSANHDDVDFACLNEFVQLSFAAKHRIPLEPETSRRRVVVDEADHLEPFDGMSEQFTEHERASLAGSVNHQSKARTSSTGVFTDQPE